MRWCSNTVKSNHPISFEPNHDEIAQSCKDKKQVTQHGKKKKIVEDWPDVQQDGIKMLRNKINIQLYCLP